MFYCPTVPIEPAIHQKGHPLDTASSPLIRAMPFYERQFKFHLQKGQVFEENIEAF
jgi:hypothetical protein